MITFDIDSHPAYNNRCGVDAFPLSPIELMGRVVSPIILDYFWILIRLFTVHLTITTWNIAINTTG